MKLINNNNNIAPNTSLINFCYILTSIKKKKHTLLREDPKTTLTYSVYYLTYTIHLQIEIVRKI